MEKRTVSISNLIQDIIKIIQTYFVEYLGVGLESEEMVSALEIKSLTKIELSRFTNIFRELFTQKLGLDFVNSITIMKHVIPDNIKAHSLERKIFFRLEKIFWAAASDEELQSYVKAAWPNKSKDLSFSSKNLNILRERREKYLTQTRNTSLYPIPKLPVNTIRSFTEDFQDEYGFYFVEYTSNFQELEID
jgi:hypothetical protein